VLELRIALIRWLISLLPFSIFLIILYRRIYVRGKISQRLYHHQQLMSYIKHDKSHIRLRQMQKNRQQKHDCSLNMP